MECCLTAGFSFEDSLRQISASSHQSMQNENQQGFTFKVVILPIHHKWKKKQLT